MLQRPDTIKTFEDLNKFIQDFFDNHGLDDLKPSGVRQAAPTASELNKGQYLISEISGVPYIYYRALSGSLYKKQLDVA